MKARRSRMRCRPAPYLAWALVSLRPRGIGGDGRRIGPARRLGGGSFWFPNGDGAANVQGRGGERRRPRRNGTRHGPGGRGRRPILCRRHARCRYHPHQLAEGCRLFVAAVLRFHGRAGQEIQVSRQPGLGRSELCDARERACAGRAGSAPPGIAGRKSTKAASGPNSAASKVGAIRARSWGFRFPAARGWSTSKCPPRKRSTTSQPPSCSSIRSTPMIKATRFKPRSRRNFAAGAWRTWWKRWSTSLPAPPSIDTREGFKFVTGMTLLDIDGGEKLSKDMNTPARVMLMGPAGDLYIRNELDDKPAVEYHKMLFTKDKRFGPGGQEGAGPEGLGPGGAQPRGGAQGPQRRIVSGFQGTRAPCATARGAAKGRSIFSGHCLPHHARHVLTASSAVSRGDSAWYAASSGTRSGNTRLW